MADVIASYNGSYDTLINLYGSLIPIHGQSFKPTSNVIPGVCKWMAVKSGSPTGNVYAKIYAATGTFGSSNVPTGDPLATSEAVSASSFPSSIDWVELEFESEITLTSGTEYVLTIETTDGTSSNHIHVGIDTTGDHEGNASLYQSGFVAYPDWDFPFYLYVSEVEHESVSGSLRSTGALGRKIVKLSKGLSGNLRGSASLSEISHIYKSLSGNLFAVGDVSRKASFYRVVDGELVFSGIISSGAYDVLPDGRLRFKGELYVLREIMYYGVANP